MDDQTTSKTWKPITNFKLVCQKCDKLNKKHHTRIYVDWNLKGYIFKCDNCKTTELFNEEGIPIKKERTLDDRIRQTVKQRKVAD